MSFLFVQIAPMLKKFFFYFFQRKILLFKKSRSTSKANEKSAEMYKELPCKNKNKTATLNGN